MNSDLSISEELSEAPTEKVNNKDEKENSDENTLFPSTMIN